MTVLDTPPQDLTTTRRSWHLLAGHVLGEERWRRTRRIGLRPRPGGMRTPADEDAGVELDHDLLVVRRGDHVDRAPLTTLGAARQLALGDADTEPTWGVELDVHDPPPTASADTSVAVHPDAAAWLATWLQVGFDALEKLAARDGGGEHPQLWPEHLDVGVDLRPDDHRASYGVSPGDDADPEPYAYVSVWWPDRLGGLDDGRWNSGTFPGAVLRAVDLVGDEDVGATLLGWFTERYERLAP